MVNSRPLTAMNEDPNSSAAISPAHILIQQASREPQERETFSGDLIHDKYQKIVALAIIFWDRWVKEYLADLQKRTKWRLVKDNIKVSELVIMLKENYCRMKWPLARITKVYPCTGRNRGV